MGMTSSSCGRTTSEATVLDGSGGISQNGVVRRKRPSKRRAPAYILNARDQQNAYYSDAGKTRRIKEFGMTIKKYGKGLHFKNYSSEDFFSSYGTSWREEEDAHYCIQQLRRYSMRNAPDALIDLAPELVVHILKYLSVKERYFSAATPLCKRQAKSVRENSNVWLPLSAVKPWRMSQSDLEHHGHTASELRELHCSLLQSIYLIRRGDVQQVAVIMTKFYYVIGIQFECLERLIIILHCERVRKRAIDAKLASCVIHALKSYQHDTELQAMALHCVVFLARPIGGAEGMVFCRGVHSQGLDAFLYGGIDAVLNSMKRHLYSSNVQAVGCWSLVNLALNRQQKIELLSKDGIYCIIQAMDKHPIALEVQFRALFALINLLIPEDPSSNNTQDPNTPLPVSDMVSLDILDRVLFAMDRFADSDKLIRCGCLVLHNLSLRPANLPVLQTAGASKPLLRAARTHNDQDVQRSATSTLRRIGVSLP